MNHLDDDAEAYALGLLGREREAGIEAHLAACAECRARVAAAESAAAALSAALPPLPHPRAGSRVARRFAAAAAAAAVVLGATTAYEANAARAASAQLARNDAALLALASSHFNHVSLDASPGVVAKAIYARDGAWYYVIVSNAPSGARVRVAPAGGGPSRDLGALAAGTPATLFARGVGRVARIEVDAAGAALAHGTPGY